MPVYAVTSSGIDGYHDDRLHLMIDDHGLRRQQNVARTIGRPRRQAEPVLRADREWEGDQVCAWGTVLRHPDDGRLQMWYTAGTMRGGRKPLPAMVCYAESSDGVRWEKPPLGVYRLGDHQETNIVLMVDGDTSHVYGGPSRRGLMAAAGGQLLGQGAPAGDFVSHFDSPNVVVDPHE